MIMETYYAIHDVMYEIPCVFISIPMKSSNLITSWEFNLIYVKYDMQSFIYALTSMVV